MKDDYRLIRILVGLTVAMLAQGCQSAATLGIDTDLQEIHCAGWQTIRPSRMDTEQTLSQIDAHNEYLRVMCLLKRMGVDIEQGPIR